MSFLTIFFALMSCIIMQEGDEDGWGGGGKLEHSKKLEEWGYKETDEDQRLGPDRILPSKAEGGLERIVDLELYIIGFPSCPAAQLLS